MPIRMTDDPQDQNQNDYNDDQGGAEGHLRVAEEVEASFRYCHC